MLPVLVMMYMGIAGALGPVLLKMAQGVEGWGSYKLLLLFGFVFFYGTGFAGMVWVIGRAPLTLTVPVWYATLLATSALLGWLVFSEKLSGYGWLAYGLIVAGLMVRLYEGVK